MNLVADLPSNETQMAADLVDFPAAVPHMASCGSPCAKDLRGPVAKNRNCVPNFPGFEVMSIAPPKLPQVTGSPR
jgi:hypothetical protein